MMHLKRLSVLLCALALTSVLGCASNPSQQSAGEYLSDAWITTRVKAALVRDSQVRATEVNVETFEGVVQLSGFVSSDTAMAQAVRITGDIEGVNSVKNDMLIR